MKRFKFWLCHLAAVTLSTLCNLYEFQLPYQVYQVYENDDSYLPRRINVNSKWHIWKSFVQHELFKPSVQFSCSVMSDSLRPPWTAAHQASLSITNFQSLLKLMSIELVMPSNHLILFHPLILLPSTFPSMRVFSNESNLHMRWPKY